MWTALRLTIGLLLLAPAPAMAQFNPFQIQGGSGPPLSESDLSQMFASIARLNAQVPVKVGSSAHWDNPATGSYGTSTVTGVLDSAGLACHLLHHEFAAGGRMPLREYDFTWCRAADGTWKIKS